jgi:hypothetical protein
MSSGEDLITTVVTEEEKTITLKDSIVAVPTGTGSIGFVPWSPLLNKSEKEVVVNKSFVVYIAEVDDDVLNQYNKMFNRLVTPPKKIIT